MAVTELWGKRFLSLTLDGTDWVCSKAIRVKGVLVFPSAANDTLVMREGSLTGPIMSKLKAGAAALEVGQYFYGDFPIQPAIKHSECTWGTVGSVIISFEFD